jgi:hypothetical protein
MTAAPWETRTPDLIADVRLYLSDQGGRSAAARRGYGCPLFTAKDTGLGGWDARMQLGDEPFEPGTERRVGFIFLTQEGLETIKEAGRFYLWEGSFVGEATVVV